MDLVPAHNQTPALFLLVSYTVCENVGRIPEPPLKKKEKSHVYARTPDRV